MILIDTVFLKLYICFPENDVPKVSTSIKVFQISCLIVDKFKVKLCDFGTT